MRIVLTSVAVLFVWANAAWAQEEVFVDVNGRQARLIACFEDVLMPAKYLVEHVLVREAYRQYVKRKSGQVELVEYPAVYRQERTLLEPAHRLLRETRCKPKKSIFGF